MPKIHHKISLKNQDSSSDQDNLESASFLELILKDMLVELSKKDEFDGQLVSSLEELTKSNLMNDPERVMSVLKMVKKKDEDNRA